MKINTFCDVIKAYTCIGKWFIDTSFFDAPPTCTDLNEYKDSFCPDESFSKFYYAFESMNGTIQKWYEYEGGKDLLTCFGDYTGPWMDFYEFDVCE